MLTLCALFLCWSSAGIMPSTNLPFSMMFVGCVLSSQSWARSGSLTSGINRILAPRKESVSFLVSKQWLEYSSKVFWKRCKKCLINLLLIPSVLGADDMLASDSDFSSSCKVIGDSRSSLSSTVSFACATVSTSDVTPRKFSMSPTFTEISACGFL